MTTVRYEDFTHLTFLPSHRDMGDVVAFWAVALGVVVGVQNSWVTPGVSGLRATMEMVDRTCFNDGERFIKITPRIRRLGSGGRW